MVEIVVWEVPLPLEPSLHNYKYRLYFGTRGVAPVRFDNQRGKGDHRHVGEREETNVFTTLEAPLEDFRRAVENWS